MSDFLKKECDLKYFHDNGYYRKKCEKCGDYYWTLDKNSKTALDSAVRQFSILKKMDIRDLNILKRVNVVQLLQDGVQISISQLLQLLIFNPM